MKMKEVWVQVRHLIDVGRLRQAVELLIHMGWERRDAWSQVRSVKANRDWEKAQVEDGTQAHLL